MINFIDTRQLENDIRSIFNKKKIVTKKGLYICFDYDSKKWNAINYTGIDYNLKEFTRIDDAIIWLRSTE